MIESCSTLQECEPILASALEDVRLLHEIGLSSVEVETLMKWVGQKLARNSVAGFDDLKENTPTCFALFLVWAGINGYDRGNYWTAVQNAIGIAVDDNWQQDWGRFFLQFLQQHRLPRLEGDGTNADVVSILLHGGIPICHLPSYFESVALPFIQTKLDSAFDGATVRNALVRYRQDEEARRQLEQLKQQLAEELGRLRQEKPIPSLLSSSVKNNHEPIPPAQSYDHLELPGEFPDDLEHYLKSIPQQRTDLQRWMEQLRDQLADLEASTLFLEGRQLLEHSEQITDTIKQLEIAQDHLAQWEAAEHRVRISRF